MTSRRNHLVKDHIAKIKEKVKWQEGNLQDL